MAARSCLHSRYPGYGQHQSTFGATVKQAHREGLALAVGALKFIRLVTTEEIKLLMSVADGFRYRPAHHQQTYTQARPRWVHAGLIEQELLSDGKAIKGCNCCTTGLYYIQPCPATSCHSRQHIGMKSLHGRLQKQAFPVQLYRA
jgi:hypothetical protein